MEEVIELSDGLALRRHREERRTAHHQPPVGKGGGVTILPDG